MEDEIKKEIEEDVVPDDNIEEAEQIVEEDEESSDDPTDIEEEPLKETKEDDEPGEIKEEESLDFPVWVKQFEHIPEGIDSPETLVESYAASLQEMKRAQTGDQKLKQVEAFLEANGIKGGVDAFINQPPRQPELQPQYNQPPQPNQPIRPVTDMLNNAVQRGQLSDDDVSYLRPILPHFDNIFSLMANYVGDMENRINKSMGEIRNNVKSTSEDTTDWGHFVKNNKDLQKASTDIVESERKRLSALKQKHNFRNYEEAFTWANIQNPNFLKEAVGSINKTAKKKAIKSLRQNFTVGRRTKSGGSKGKTTPNISNYINEHTGELDGDQLQRDLDNKVIDDAFFEKVTDIAMGK